MKDDKNTVPNDLGIKIGSPNEKFWTDLKKKIEDDVLMAQRQIEVNEHILEFAKEKILQEQKV